ncbi:succinyl-CoA synthetase beta subunit [Catenuloplanes nepalensis]|uniref:Succinate--CoA ligase [ADP-forming] subunit beta n=1 Tax=Catenuloplanes nepalensis TaxID=587533 RepID=A0ABT9MPD7_9ACTN|nr:ADP-forming succinate--CoA ligase subunit beta [Catenuloplanes nepalensis]MDP9793249.1 succinyl-CoA synthetase beta subunit [Catenuloplanes nepalensis]
MDLFEHQAHALFARHGIPTGRRHLARTPAEAAAAASAIGGPVVVKAQVKTGGRGKAGGVRLAPGPDEAATVAAGILGMDIHGHTVHSVLVTEASEIAAEFYVALLLDRAAGGFLALLSRAGGMDVESAPPELLTRAPIDVETGLTDEHAHRLVADSGLPSQVAPVLTALWRLLHAEDATLAEINPLARLSDGTIRALDGKVTLDGNAAFRQPQRASLAGLAATDPREAAAARKHLNYVKLDGTVGVIGNGAGLVMSTLDVVARAGAAPANFLDIGGGASARVMADSLEIVLSDPDVTAVLVNVFGGITACDAVADGILQAYWQLTDGGRPLRAPLIVRLDGNNAERGRRMLAAAALPGVLAAETMDGAATLAAATARQEAA